MDDDYRGPEAQDRVSARTSKRVAEMNDAERAALARELARRTRAAPEARVRPAVRAPDARPSAKTPNNGRAEAAARLTAELRKTERHLDRVERASSPSRYGGGSSLPASARSARLLSPADRLERQLRKLR
jgi:hypothetical protein